MEESFKVEGKLTTVRSLFEQLIMRDEFSSCVSAILLLGDEGEDELGELIGVEGIEPCSDTI